MALLLVGEVGGGGGVDPTQLLLCSVPSFDGGGKLCSLLPFGKKKILKLGDQLRQISPLGKKSMP